jgi:trans-aconitate methyltransferase
VAGQQWSAEAYATNARFVADLGAPLIELLAPKPGERILDLGCGDGALTETIAATGAVVTGLDAAPDLVRAARARGLSVILADAHEFTADQPFDAVVSNAALHWMREPDRVLASVARALRPGGRFVAEQGGHGNVAAIVVAVTAALEAHGHPERATSPWDFPSPALARRRLARAGFEVASMALLPRPTPLPTGMAGWLDTFAGPFVEGLPEAVKRQVLEDTVRRLAPVLRDADGAWSADYVRLRFVALQPA